MSKISRKGKSLNVPLLARAAASRRTSYVNDKNVGVAYRDPEFFSDSPIAIMEAWANMKGLDDDLQNPDSQTTVIALSNFTLTLPAKPAVVDAKRQRLFGVKVAVSGNTNLNTGAKMDNTLRFVSQNNINIDTKIQMKLKAFQAEYYHFFSKSIAQVVQPAIINHGEWIPDTVAPPVFFQQLMTFFGTGTDGLTIQIEPLNSRHPDVISLFKNLGRVRRFLQMIQKKYRFLCDESSNLDYQDWDEVEFDEDDITLYDLDSAE